MANTFNLEIITPERLFYEGEVEMIIVRTLEGYEGFLAHHAWACKLLGTGKLRIKEAGSREFKEAAITGGFIDVKDRVVVYTDAAEWPDEIDIDRVQQKIHEAEEILRGGCNQREAQLAKLTLVKAVNRMKVKGVK